MTITIITDGQPYIFEKVTYICVEHDDYIYRADDIILEEKDEENERTNIR